jgi:bifunctional non-homologous end joining protein LigD
MSKDLFEDKQISPMLIGAESGPFDDDNCIFELKLDGVRGLAYLDADICELRNKRNIRVSPIYPELANINQQVKQCCILDGEIVVFKDGKPNFFEMQRRALTTDKIKISLAATRLPVSFIAYDILYANGERITQLPLMERKQILAETVKESERMAISRYIDSKGIALYNLAEQQELEGVVAKRKDSKYYFGRRSKDWIKIKYLKDEDYVICGYIRKDKGMVSLVLGQYAGHDLVYKGHVTLGVSGDNLRRVMALPKAKAHDFIELPPGNNNAVWVKPILVGIVQYMPRGEVKSQPVFKGLRDDKLPEECHVARN